MSTSSFVKYNKFNPEELVFSEPKVNAYGGKSVYIHYGDNKSRFYLQTANMYMPYDTSAFTSKTDPNAPPKYTMNVSFGAAETDSKVKACHKAFESFDKAILAAAKKNSVAWFGEQHEDVVLKAFYSPLVKKHREGKYPDTLKYQLPFRDGKAQFEIWTKDKQLVNLEEDKLENHLAKGSEVSAMLTINSVWFAGGKFGVSLRLYQCIAKPIPKITGLKIDDSDDEEEDDGQGSSSLTNTVTTSGQDDLDNIVVDSSSDEDSSEEEPEPEPEPEPKKKKTKGRKKKGSK